MKDADVDEDRSDETLDDAAQLALIAAQNAANSAIVAANCATVAANLATCIPVILP